MFYIGILSWFYMCQSPFGYLVVELFGVSWTDPCLCLQVTHAMCRRVSRKATTRPVLRSSLWVSLSTSPVTRRDPRVKEAPSPRAAPATFRPVPVKAAPTPRPAPATLPVILRPAPAIRRPASRILSSRPRFARSLRSSAKPSCWPREAKGLKYN